MLLLATLTLTTWTLVTSAFASGESFEVKIDLLLNGKHISSPRVILKEGESATIIQKTKTVDNFIEVRAFKNEAPNQEGILMKLIVGEIGEGGKRTIVSQPQILTKENEPSQITVNAKEKGSEKLSLSVVAKKKML